MPTQHGKLVLLCSFGCATYSAAFAVQGISSSAGIPTSADLRGARDNEVAGMTATVWSKVVAQAAEAGQGSAVLAPFLSRVVTSRATLPEAVGHYLADKIACGVPRDPLAHELAELLGEPRTCAAMVADLVCVAESDPAAPELLTILLHYKGFLALQSHRAASLLWHKGDAGARQLALLLQGRASELFDVDIHPGAAIGPACFFDHACGVVIGEQASLGYGCYVLHGVTLGATGKRDKKTGRRHPAIGDRVTIGSGASVLGPITVGEGATIGSGAVVTKTVAEGATVIDTSPMKNRVLLPRKLKSSAEEPSS